MSEMGAFRSMVRDETLGIAIGVVFLLWFGRAIALKLALRVAYKKNKSALMVLKLLGGKSPSLFEFQKYLPNLPVPRLKDTLRNWLLSVEPLVSAADFKKAQVHVLAGWLSLIDCLLPRSIRTS